MQTRQLGNTDMHITSIGLGTWAIGGPGWAASWGAQDDNDSIAAIHRAVDLGLNWLDTAAVYGLGHAEEIVGRALKGRSNRPYIFTKCSRKIGADGKLTGVLKADSIRQEVEDSLRRLQVDVIDLYQIHRPVPDEDIEEGWRTMADLKRAGKVRYIGVSNFNVDQLRRIQEIAPVSSLQPPYSLIRREAEEEILPFCQQHNIGVIVYSPMASGLLTGAMTPERILSLPQDDWRTQNPQFREPLLSRNMALVTLLYDIGKRHDKTPGEVAIAWTLHNPAVTAAIVGSRRPAQLDQVIGAADFRLSKEEVQEIEAFFSTH
ncbi:MAG: aldo/keto reductase [Ktedonobacteraceae bacterium]|nr:aldo/keto reductase [Ktedonobacteraceae bacterium]MBV9710768.1 aldo/keto reductase [Ktedonobacteraceae bacterium]